VSPFAAATFGASALRILSSHVSDWTLSTHQRSTSA
jgi:hypothetical protein